MIQPDVGDKLLVSWPSDADCTSKPLVGKVVEIISSKKEKRGSNLKYKIFFKKLNETKVTRLHNLEWSFKKKGSSKSQSISESTANEVLFSNNKPFQEVTFEKERTFKKPKLTSTSKGSSSIGNILKDYLHHILAPMVGASELPFRLLCRRYGATLAYTPMISSDRFAVDAKYREEEFQTVAADRPLVAHFSANNPEVFLAAAKHVESFCDAIDLNLGCPQRVAFSGHFGSFLLDKEDRPLVMKMVRTLADQLTIPVFVKIRLLTTVEESLELCQQLIDSGAALIAIHARYRVNLVGRTGPGARDGAAHLDQVQEIITRLRAQGGRYGEVPIIANGNVRTWSDVQGNLSSTSADGIMSAEGLLDNPALFNGGVDVDALQLAEEYLDLVERFPTKMKSVVFHIRRMCRELLTSYQLLEECVSCATLSEMRSVLSLLRERRDGGNFQWDADKEKKAKEAIERRKREEGKRKAFEDRMKRKAKREGLAAEHYLRIGASPPTKDEVDRLKTLPKEEAMALWKKDHAQHCYDFHFNAQGCLRDRTCAFLHTEFTVNLTPNEELEVYG